MAHYIFKTHQHADDNSVISAQRVNDNGTITVLTEENMEYVLKNLRSLLYSDRQVTCFVPEETIKLLNSEREESEGE